MGDSGTSLYKTAKRLIRFSAHFLSWSFSDYLKISNVNKIRAHNTPYWGVNKNQIEEWPANVHLLALAITDFLVSLFFDHRRKLLSFLNFDQGISACPTKSGLALLA